MIGTKVKGFRHLFRMMSTLHTADIFFKPCKNMVGGTALYCDDKKYSSHYCSNSPYIIIFNYQFANVRFNVSDFNTDVRKEIEGLYSKYGNAWVLTPTPRSYREASQYFSNIIVMPSDFEERYSEFIAANKKAVTDASRYVGGDCNNSSLKYFYAITDGSKNFFSWAVKAYIKTRISVYTIDWIMGWNSKYSQLSNKLKKNTITAYTSHEDFVDIIQELITLRRNKRANDVISTFNTAQKKALKGFNMGIREYDILSKFSKLSLRKKQNFIRKVSTFTDPAEIIKHMSFLTDVHFEWNKESVLNVINNTDNINCEIIIDKDDCLLVKVNDYDTVKRLAKTTNWCISKDKKYWNQYVRSEKGDKQYMLFDFSLKEDDNYSIVGFTTTKNKGITRAHDFQNNNIVSSDRRDMMSEIQSFIAHIARATGIINIYSVLDKNGIDPSILSPSVENKYEWNRNSMFAFLDTCLNGDGGYYIIHEDATRVAFICDNPDIRFFLGDAFLNTQREYNQTMNSDLTVIVFADFAKKGTDPNKLVYGIISHNFSSHEDSCRNLYNEACSVIPQTFDSKIREYDLPYDIICRNKKSIERFYESWHNYELSNVKYLLSDKGVVKRVLNSSVSERNIYMALSDVTFNCYSLDYINVLYDNGIKLSAKLSARRFYDFIQRIYNAMCEFCQNGNTSMVTPSEEMIKNVLDGKVDDQAQSGYVGFYEALDIIMKNDMDAAAPYIIYILSNEHNISPMAEDIFIRILSEKPNILLNEENINSVNKWLKDSASIKFIDKMRELGISPEKYFETVINSIRGKHSSERNLKESTWESAISHSARF